MIALDGKVVVVTGGAGAIGRAFVHAISKAGGRAIVADIDVAAAERVARDAAAGAELAPEAAALDITSKESIVALLDGLQARHGRVDAVVNNAYPRNRNYGRRMEDVTYQDFCENTNSHLGGYFLVMQQFGRFFRGRGGSIVNMSSIYGVMAPRFEVYAGTPMTMPVEYAAIKSAVVHLTRYFAQYLKSDGVRVNCISPGGILGNQPQAFLDRYNAHCGGKGMLEPGDVSGSLLFLLSDASRHVTGQNIVVDDGFSL